ncbi:MAG: WD40 repeat domain-containing protein [Terriglobia bacterium]
MASVRMLRLMALVLLAIFGARAQIAACGGSADSARVAADSSELSLLRNLPTAPSADKAAHSHPIYSLAVTPDGKTLVSAGDQTIKFWSFVDGSLLNVVKEPGDVGKLAMVPDGTMLVSTLGETPMIKGRRASRPIGRIRLWSLSEGRLIQTLQGHAARVNALAVTPDGRFLVSGSADKTVKVWSLPDGALLKTISHKNAVTALAIAPDGRTLATADSPYYPPSRRPIRVKRYDAVKLWSLPEGRALKSLAGPNRNVRALSVTPDGKLLIAATTEEPRSIWAWSLPDGHSAWALGSVASSVDSLAVSRDGKTLAAAGSFMEPPSRYSVWLLSLPDGRSLSKLDLMAGFRDARWSAEAVLFAPDGKSLAAGDFVGHAVLSRGLSQLGRCALVDPKATAWVPSFGR